MLALVVMEAQPELEAEVDAPVPVPALVSAPLLVRPVVAPAPVAVPAPELVLVPAPQPLRIAAVDAMIATMPTSRTMPYPAGAAADAPGHDPDLVCSRTRGKSCISGSVPALVANHAVGLRPVTGDTAIDGQTTWPTA